MAESTGQWDKFLEDEDSEFLYAQQLMPDGCCRAPEKKWHLNIHYLLKYGNSQHESVAFGLQLLRQIWNLKKKKTLLGNNTDHATAKSDMKISGHPEGCPNKCLLIVDQKWLFGETN